MRQLTCANDAVFCHSLDVWTAVNRYALQLVINLAITTAQRYGQIGHDHDVDLKAGLETENSHTCSHTWPSSQGSSQSLGSSAV